MESEVLLHGNLQWIKTGEFPRQSSRFSSFQSKRKAQVELLAIQFRRRSQVAAALQGKTRGGVMSLELRLNKFSALLGVDKP